MFLRCQPIKCVFLPQSLLFCVLFCSGCVPQGNKSQTASGMAAAEATHSIVVLGSDATRSVKFSPDGKSFATANADQTVSVWNVEAKLKSARLTGHLASVYSLAFHPEGKLLASAGCEYSTKKGEILIWNLDTNRVVKTLELQDVVFAQISFSPDRKDRPINSWRSYESCRSGLVTSSTTIRAT